MALRALFVSPADSLLRKQSLSTETRTMAPERGGPHVHGGQAVGAGRRGREQPRRCEERRCKRGPPPWHVSNATLLWNLEVKKNRGVAAGGETFTPLSLLCGYPLSFSILLSSRKGDD